MVNTMELRSTRLFVTVYVVLVAMTVVLLAALSAAGSSAATTDAWVHTLVVGAFAVLLPVRVHAAGRGSHGALRAIGIIAVVLCGVNLVEACVPGLFPLWLRVEMVGIAALMVAVAVSAVRARRMMGR